MRGLRIIEAPRATTRDAAQQVSVVVILPAQEFFVVVEFPGNTDLVAGGTEFGSPMERLKEGLLVKGRFSFDQLAVDVTQHRVGAVGKRVVDWLFDEVVGVALSAADLRNRVAGRTR